MFCQKCHTQILDDSIKFINIECSSLKYLCSLFGRIILLIMSNISFISFSLSLTFEVVVNSKDSLRERISNTYSNIQFVSISDILRVVIRNNSDMFLLSLLLLMRSLTYGVVVSLKNRKSNPNEMNSFTNVVLISKWKLL